jgi:membrane-associated protein
MIKTFMDFLLHVDKYLNLVIQNYGGFVYFLLFLIIFLETGFVLTPFLPGDSLLFVAGTFAAASTLNVYILFFIFSLASILGDTANYWIGHHFGKRIFSRFIKKEHMQKTKSFFHKHGKKTIVLARFIPIIRTFAPFVAGIGKMDYFTFLSYNIIGGIVWVALFLFSGYFFGNIAYVKDNLGMITLLIIATSLIPAIIEYVKHKKKKK